MKITSLEDCGSQPLAGRCSIRQDRHRGAERIARNRTISHEMGARGLTGTIHRSEMLIVGWDSHRRLGVGIADEGKPMRGDKVFSQCAPRPRPPGFDVLYQAFGLSSRMTTAVALACNGLEAKEIAARMGVSESAVKKQFRSASLRIGTRGRGHLCAVCSLLAVGLSRAEAEAVLATRVAAT